MPPGRFLHVLVAAGSAVTRAGFRAFERRRVERVSEPVPPPIFIVGHWRSGTTHLYNILTRDPRFAYPHPFATGLPWEFLVLGKLLRPLLRRSLPEDRWVDPIPVRPDSPQEDEIALASMQPLSYYHGIYFPEHLRENVRRGVFLEGCEPEEVAAWEKAFLHFLRKLWIEQDRRRLLIKNPVYTARVDQLRTLFPDARFVHIHRNPFEVYGSSCRFWRTLLRELAWQDPGVVSDEEVEELVLETYPRMMEKLVEDRSGLPEEVFVEVGYEELERDPLGVVRRIYGSLSLEGYEEVEPRFAGYLDSIRDYERRTYTFAPETVERIRERWGPFLERWGYGVPA